MGGRLVVIAVVEPHCDQHIDRVRDVNRVARRGGEARRRARPAREGRKDEDAHRIFFGVAQTAT